MSATFPPQEAWIEFAKMRKQIKKPMTAYAEKLMIKRLEAFAADGQDAEAMLNQSILNCWQNIYPVKDERVPNEQRQQFQTPTEKARDWAAGLTGGRRNDRIIDINEHPTRKLG